MHEHEPAKALALLATDDVDLVLTYDYNLAPAGSDATLDSRMLWSTSWGLGVPAHAARDVRGDAIAVFGAFRDHDWIGNSRNRADEDVVRLGAFAHTRRGRSAWPPLRLVLDRLDPGQAVQGRC